MFRDYEFPLKNIYSIYSRFLLPCQAIWAYLPPLPSILVPAYTSGGQVCKGVADVLLLLIHLDGIAAGHIAVFSQGNHMAACHFLEADGGNADVIAIHIQFHLLRCGDP